MVLLNSNLSILFWNVIFETLRRKDETENPSLVIISPWMSDIEIENSRWSPGALESLRESLGWNGSFNRLSDVLSAAVNAGVEVKVYLAANNGKFLEKTSDLQVEREAALITRLEKGGVECFFKPDFHFKRILSPFAYLSGSSNFTVNGLTGKLQEEINWSHIDRDLENYTDGVENVNLFTADKYWKVSDVKNLSDFPKTEIQTTGSSIEGLLNQDDFDISEVKLNKISDVTSHPARPKDYLEPSHIAAGEEGSQNESIEDNLLATLGALNDQTMSLAHDIGIVDETEIESEHSVVNVEKIRNSIDIISPGEGESELIGPTKALKSCMADIVTAGQMIASGQCTNQETAKVLVRATSNYATAQRSRVRLKAKIRV